jgi:hypothetical protein
MLATGYLFTLLTGPSTFGVEQVELPALRWTEAGALEASLGLPAGTNVFRIATEPLEARLASLPAVRSAEVTVSVVDATVAVRLVEREPILAWRVETTAFLADPDGVVVAVLPSEADAARGLPAIVDRRRDAAAALAVGARLDPVELDVATRLASLEPAEVGSRATSLEVVLTVRDGFVLRGPTWDAVFGFYGPATRDPAMIPGQVRLLRSLLADREDAVERIILASETDGTYVPRPTPRPTRR